jgi:DNA-binding transcriptional ArsR family regulator
VEPLKVIAARRRRQILQLVWDRELPAGEIARHFDVSWPAISQHLGILREAGFVIERREGTSRLYRADREALGALRAVVEAQWEAGLDRLADLAEAEQAATDKDDS